VGQFDLAGVQPLSLPCTGMLPPAAIDYALRSAGFDGVVVTGCEAGDCFHRYGDRWTRERIERKRMPMLRGRVARESLRIIWLKATESARLRREIETFRHGLASGKSEGGDA
jgi:coenzyme F420-reducing hydrogenase delta subunit